MNNETLLASALIAAPALLYGGNRLRLAIAQHIIDKALAPFQGQIEEFKDKKHFTILPHDNLVEANNRLQQELDKDHSRKLYSKNTPIPFEQPLPRFFKKDENFPEYVKHLVDGFRISYPGFAFTAIASDVATDALLNEALLRAFPNSAHSAGVGELSDIMLGPELKEIINATGVIDCAASFLDVTAGVVGETVVVTAVETIADPHLAIFSAISITGREMRLIKAGYSTPGESALYGTLDYAGRVAGAAAGGALGGKGGSAFGPLGALIGALAGGITGALCARAIWRQVLKAEIKTMSDDFRRVVRQAKKSTKRGTIRKIMRQMVKFTHAAAQPAFQNYKKVLRNCPDFYANAKLSESTRQCALDYSFDYTSISAHITRDREKIVDSLRFSGAPQPTTLHKILGADWIKAADKRLRKLGEEKLLPLEPVRVATTQAALKTQPLGSLVSFIKFGYVVGGQTESLSRDLPKILDGITDHHREETKQWETACTSAWQKATDETKAMFNRGRDSIAAEYYTYRERLHFLQRAILNKSMRLNPNFR